MSSADYYSLTEVAGLLGKSLRQVRYAVQVGQLPATKVGSRWLIKKKDVDVSPSSEQVAAVTKVEAARARRYSVRDLRAFQVGEAIYRDALTTFGEKHETPQRLRAALEAVALGCHAFESGERITCFNDARRGLDIGQVELIWVQNPLKMMRRLPTGLRASLCLSSAA